MSKIKISNEIDLISLTIYLPKYKTLIISDVHIGYEEALNKQGILLPRVFFKHVYEKTRNIISEVDFDTVVLNGDLKHEFGDISKTEWRHTIKFLSLFKNKNIFLVKGNHDKILSPIAEECNLKLVDYYQVGSFLIVHGDKIIDINKIEKNKLKNDETNNKNSAKKIDTIIIGHEHPAITLVGENRSETYKCFLIGKYKNYKLIAMPSYNEITDGTNILQENVLSPYLKHNLDNFEVVVYGKELLHFGKLKDLKKLQKKN
ncbi:MAG: metallophosphoesterase [Candidatus Woesearchaeota archaeon]